MSGPTARRMNRRQSAFICGHGPLLRAAIQGPGANRGTEQPGPSVLQSSSPFPLPPCPLSQTRPSRTCNHPRQFALRVFGAGTCRRKKKRPRGPWGVASRGKQPGLGGKAGSFGPLLRGGTSGPRRALALTNMTVHFTESSRTDRRLILQSQTAGIPFMPAM